MTAAALLSGCAIPKRLPAVPQEYQDKAEVMGMPGVRYVVGDEMPEFVRDARESLKREREYLAKTGHVGPLPPVYFLAISGGGDNGAFGAGLLSGWTAAGNQPIGFSQRRPLKRAKSLSQETRTAP